MRDDFNWFTDALLAFLEHHLQALSSQETLAPCVLGTTQLLIQPHYKAGAEDVDLYDLCILDASEPVTPMHSLYFSDADFEALGLTADSNLHYGLTRAQLYHVFKHLILTKAHYTQTMQSMSAPAELY